MHDHPVGLEVASSDVDLDVEPAGWVGLVTDALQRRRAPTWVRNPILVVAVLATIPAAWITVVAPLLLASATIEWLVKNFWRFHQHHGLAILVGVGAVAWTMVFSGLVGWTLGRRQRAVNTVAFIELADSTLPDDGSESSTVSIEGSSDDARAPS